MDRMETTREERESIEQLVSSEFAEVDTTSDQHTLRWTVPYDPNVARLLSAEQLTAMLFKKNASADLNSGLKFVKA